MCRMLNTGGAAGGVAAGDCCPTDVIAVGVGWTALGLLLIRRGTPRCLSANPYHSVAPMVQTSALLATVERVGCKRDARNLLVIEERLAPRNQDSSNHLHSSA